MPMSCSPNRPVLAAGMRSETAGWVEGICREHLVIGAAVKVLLLVMAELGYCTLWFACRFGWCGCARYTADGDPCIRF